ncbi:MAG TPA: hypothetical protein VIA98_01240 [Allosphingosinicella sp.]|jgi:hypothetical protein
MLNEWSDRPPPRPPKPPLQRGTFWLAVLLIAAAAAFLFQLAERLLR